MLYYNKRANDVGEMDIRTPYYTTIKEQNYVTKMDIRTSRNTTINEQNYVCFEL